MIEFKSFASSSSGNLNTISDGTTTIMLDCGIPWKKVMKAFDFKVSTIVSAVCLSHSHKDHSQSIEDAAKSGLDIYLLPETRKELGLSGYKYHDITPLKEFSVGTFKVLPFPLEHDVPNCGFLMASTCGEKAIYITDTYYCRYKFLGLNIIAIECNFSKSTIAKDIHPAHKKRLWKSHMSLETLVDFLNANDLSMVREIHLLHLSTDNANAQEMKEAIQGNTGIPVYIAPEGGI